MGLAKDSTTFRVVISGYYGFQNSGDEAVLRSILLALLQQGEKQGITVIPVVLSNDPEWTSRMYGVEAAPRMQPASLIQTISSADALISGGGSLLQDATGLKSIPYYTGILKLAQWLRKPTFIYAQGIGPVHRKALYPFIASAMKGSRYISVRDEESARFLRTIGVKQPTIAVVPDPVMGMPLPAPSLEQGRRLPDVELPRLGISVRFWNKDRSDLKRIATSLAALAARKDVQFTFLPFHTPDDVEASRFVAQQLEGLLKNSKLEIIELPDDPQVMLQAVSECDALFGMRLHALIYAANQRVPMLGLSYDPKIDQFLKRLDETPIGTTEHVDPEQFAEKMQELLQHREQWQEQHRRQIDTLIEQSQQPAQQIIQFLRQHITR